MKNLLLLALFAALPAMALDLKGVKMGEVATHAQLLDLGCREADPRFPWGSYCTGWASFGEDVGGSLSVDFGAGNTVETVMISFRVRNLDAILKAATSKWGKPRVSSAPMSNGYGARFTERMWTWKEPSGANATLYSIDTSEPGNGVLLLNAHPTVPAKAKL